MKNNETKKRPITNKPAIRKYIVCLLDKEQTSLAKSGIFNSNADYAEKNKEIALSIIRFALEDVLQYKDPWDMIDQLNSKIVTEMKLDDAVARLKLPDGSILEDDYSYLIAEIYPWIKDSINLQDLTIRTYKRVLDDANRKSFVRRFFAGIDGRKRSKYCLHYLLQRTSSCFKSVEDLYEFFSGVGGDRFLTNNKLKLAKQLYTSDVEYLHNTLSSKQRDDFLFHYYQSLGLFWGAKRKLARISRAVEKVERTKGSDTEDDSEE